MHGVRTAPDQYSRRQLSILRKKRPRIRRLPRPSGASPEPPARHVRPAHPALPNKTIAKRLGLSEATVRSYISEIFAALGYTNRGELTITAIKAGY